MSQKKETLVLTLAVFLTAGITGVIIWFLVQSSGWKLNNGVVTDQVTGNPATMTERISFGERILTPGDAIQSKKEGVAAFKDKNYAGAIAALTTAIKSKPNDPETLIFLNNARAATTKSYTIIVSSPLGTDPNKALETLRGVAQAQNEINLAGGIKGFLLKVGIASDDDNTQISAQIATNLVNNPEVLGVIGHNSSDATLAAGAIYNSGKLVAISANSTSMGISNFSHYVFRTVPSDLIAARTLASYMLKTLQKKKATIFFNSQSKYSQSLKSEFTTSILQEGGQITNEFDLSKTDFSATQSLAQASKQGTQVLMLVSTSDTLDKALQVVQVNQKHFPLLGGDDIYTLKTLQVGSGQAEGMVVAVPWHIRGDSKTDFPQKSRQLWGGDVNWRTALAYDATKAFIAALNSDPSRSGVQQALASSNFSATGASEVIRFLPSGDRQAPVQLVKIVPGNRSGNKYDFEPVGK